MQTAAATITSAKGSTPKSGLTLDALAERSYDSLEAMYRRAACPGSLRAADGALRGRMLAVRGIDVSPVASLVRAFAGSRSFVWEGKTFEVRTEQEGKGINRIAIPGVLGRQNLFPFATRLGPSALDEGRALILDYDLPENPPWIRRIHDEVREVEPGLFLGPAMWKAASGPTTVLWFALDARR